MEVARARFLHDCSRLFAGVNFAALLGAICLYTVFKRRCWLELTQLAMEQVARGSHCLDDRSAVSLRGKKMEKTVPVCPGFWLLRKLRRP